MTHKFLACIRPLLKVSFDLSETMKVLTHNQPIFWSWGTSKRYNLDNRGLLLKVNAKYHKSYVLITLNGNDTYCVDIISSQGNILKNYSEVYFDQLTEVIDSRIETYGY
jgi:hypothetical protein